MLQVVLLLLTTLQIFTDSRVNGYIEHPSREYSINSKTICVEELSSKYERITCRLNNKIDIVDAGLYNVSTIDENNITTTRCMPVDQTTPLVKKATKALKLECSSYSCLIQRATIYRLLDDTDIDINNLVLEINYSCRPSSSINSINSHPAAYSFTYFFYIITLVLSTSCILVGAIFILRKFLIMRRRRNMFWAQRTRQNQGYVPNSNSEGSDDSGQNNGVWTTAYPPPSYENIYENSLPINPLPDYNTTLKNDSKKNNDNTALTENETPVTTTSEPPNVLYQNPGEIVTISNPAFIPDLPIDRISVDNLEIDKGATQVINKKELNQKV